MMNSLILLCLLLAIIVSDVKACSRRKRRQPPPPPPPGSPPQPPPPPPIVKVRREAVQQMTRNNCKQVRITPISFDSVAVSDLDPALVAGNKDKLEDGQCLGAEDFEYECEFSVFSEIALTVVYHPTGCACAFTVQVVEPRPKLPDISGLLSVNAAYETEVTRFAIVVYDFVAGRIETEIPQFSNMQLNENTAKLIKDQLAKDPNGDFTSVTVAFAGTVRDFKDLPDQLNKNDPKNQNYIPAIMFTIKQKYKTGAMFSVPCELHLHTPPNAFKSRCTPHRPNVNVNAASRKRNVLGEEEAANAQDKAWKMEFYLFPKQSNKCGMSGYVPKSRFITSFYNDPDCKHTNGYLSFDREFTSTVTPSSAAVGAWRWERNFDRGSTRVVFGVPHRFAPLTSVWCLGYSQISWTSPSEFKQTNVPIAKGVCTALPNAAQWKSERELHKYKETHPSYPLTAGVQCAQAFHSCSRDVTLLAFQNRNPREFAKLEDSVLLTGPRRAFCTEFDQAGAELAVFDAMTFEGVVPGAVLAKKRHTPHHEVHMVYSAEHDGLLHARHAPHLVHAANLELRKREAKPMYIDPVAAPPHRDNFSLNMATGSADKNGLDGPGSGDHPIRKPPESYSAPLTLDPVQAADPNEPAVYDAQEISGLPTKFCEHGSVGCTCRAEEHPRGACDAPYECSSLNFCERPACPHGDAGCKVHSDGTCNDKALIVDNGHCVYKPSCELGSIGCLCRAGESEEDACDADSLCLDGRCLRPAEGICSPGEPGCPCDDAGQCNGGASCDEYSGVCLHDSCHAGTPGCRCMHGGANPCTGGFGCSGDKCLVTECVIGSPGCSCLAGKKCNLRGFQCVELDRNGDNTACVGREVCSDKPRTAHCNDVCGVGNVAVCGNCDYSQPVCRNPDVQYCDKNSYLYGVEPCPTDSATSLTTAVVAVLVAVALALF